MAFHAALAMKIIGRLIGDVVARKVVNSKADFAIFLVDLQVEHLYPPTTC
jgi:hypothetical protein